MTLSKESSLCFFIVIPQSYVFVIAKNFLCFRSTDQVHQHTGCVWIPFCMWYLHVTCTCWDKMKWPQDMSYLLHNSHSHCVTLSFSVPFLNRCSFFSGSGNKMWNRSESLCNFCESFFVKLRRKWSICKKQNQMQSQKQDNFQANIESRCRPVISPNEAQLLVTPHQKHSKSK